MCCRVKLHFQAASQAKAHKKAILCMSPICSMFQLHRGALQTHTLIHKAIQEEAEQQSRRSRCRSYKVPAQRLGWTQTTSHVHTCVTVTGCRAQRCSAKQRTHKADWQWCRVARIYRRRTEETGHAALPAAQSSCHMQQSNSCTTPSTRAHCTEPKAVSGYVKAQGPA